MASKPSSPDHSIPPPFDSQPVIHVQQPGEPAASSSSTRFGRASISPTTSPATTSPSSRRVASPAGARIAHAGSQDPPSPEGSHQSGIDVFERDVEFSPEHLLSPQEAVEVAIPPVLSEAAAALATDDLPTVLARVASSASISAHPRGPEPPDGVGLSPLQQHHDGYAPIYLPQAIQSHQAGWQSPSLTYALEQAGSPSSSSADYDSPPGWERGYTPATSPSPPLLEAKLAAACVSEPPLSASPLSSAPGSPRSLSPGPVLTTMPFPTAGSTAAALFPTTGGSPLQPRSLMSSTTEGPRDRRRLSFMSYADLINIERGKPPSLDSSLDLGALATAISSDELFDADRSKEDDELTISRHSRPDPRASDIFGVVNR